MTLDDAIHRAAEESKDHRGHVMIWLSLGLVLAGALALGALVFIGRASNEDLSTQVEQISRQSAQNADTAAKLAEQVRALGAVPVVEAPAVAATVDPAVLRQAARAAVDDYCAVRNQCRGADGSTPDVNQIVTAVVARIPAPTPGQDGADGSDGEPGQDATTDQVAAAVAAYCGQPDEPCRGPVGAQGASGQDGAEGAVGPPGPICPDGYTAQSRRQGFETWWVCVSDEPSLPIPPN